MRFIKSSLKGGDIEVHYHDVDLSFLEAVVARGDEKISRVIERAWRAGARFDGWNDQLNLSAWLRANILVYNISQSLSSSLWSEGQCGLSPFHHFFHKLYRESVHS